MSRKVKNPDKRHSIGKEVIGWGVSLLIGVLGSVISANILARVADFKSPVFYYDAVDCENKRVDANTYVYIRPLTGSENSFVVKMPITNDANRDMIIDEVELRSESTPESIQKYYDTNIDQHSGYGGIEIPLDPFDEYAWFSVTLDNNRSDKEAKLERKGENVDGKNCVNIRHGDTEICMLKAVVPDNTKPSLYSFKWHIEYQVGRKKKTFDTNQYNVIFWNDKDDNTWIGPIPPPII